MCVTAFRSNVLSIFDLPRCNILGMLCTHCILLISDKMFDDLMFNVLIIKCVYCATLFETKCNILVHKKIDHTTTSGKLEFVCKLELFSMILLSLKMIMIAEVC